MDDSAGGAEHKVSMDDRDGEAIPLLTSSHATGSSSSSSVIDIEAKVGGDHCGGKVQDVEEQV